MGIGPTKLTPALKRFKGNNLGNFAPEHHIFLVFRLMKGIFDENLCWSGKEISQ
jgi:hypothetical protein